MKQIKVLGTGCVNCKATQKLIEECANANSIDIEIEKLMILQTLWLTVSCRLQA